MALLICSRCFHMGSSKECPTIYQNLTADNRVPYQLCFLGGIPNFQTHPAKYHNVGYMYMCIYIYIRAFYPHRSLLSPIEMFFSKPLKCVMVVTNKHHILGWTFLPLCIYVLTLSPILLVPSGEHTKSYGKSPFLMGKSTISMAIFNSYVDITRG